MTPGFYLLQRGDLYSRELRALSPGDAVDTVYNPLEYAREPWRRYLERYVDAPREVVFLGMNPGPWGMAQTGVPFGEVAAVREWLQIEEAVGTPAREHPKRPIEGFACSRSEVSGRRLWGLFRERYGRADAFFARHAVMNYCPLVFMADTGRNVTPDKLPVDARRSLFAICDRYLADTVVALRPRFVVGVGAFARKRLEQLDEEALRDAEDRYVAAQQGDNAAQETGSRRSGNRHEDEDVDADVANDGVPQPIVTSILHPSPASPAANRGWAEAATAQLIEAGVWTTDHDR